MAVTLSQTTATLYAGYTLQLIATDSLSGTITWSTSDGSSMTVVNGLVSCLIGKGNVNITATSSAGGSATCVVTGYGISVSKVGKMLGSSSTSVGTLCSSTRINKWSLHKPVRRNTVTGPNNVWNSGNFYKYNNYLRFNNHDYMDSGGINIELIGINDTISDILSNIENKVNKYNYIAPTGGVTSPYRLGDFRAYTSEIPEFNLLVDSSNKSIESYFYDNSQHVIRIIYSNWDTFHCLQKQMCVKLSDMWLDENGTVSLNDYYLSVIVKTYNNSYYIKSLFRMNSELNEYYELSEINKFLDFLSVFPENMLHVNIPFSRYYFLTKSNISTSVNITSDLNTAVGDITSVSLNQSFYLPSVTSNSSAWYISNNISDLAFLHLTVENLTNSSYTLNIGLLPTPYSSYHEVVWNKNYYNEVDSLYIGGNSSRLVAINSVSPGTTYCVLMSILTDDAHLYWNGEPSQYPWELVGDRVLGEVIGYIWKWGGTDGFTIPVTKTGQEGSLVLYIGTPKHYLTVHAESGLNTGFTLDVLFENPDFSDMFDHEIEGGGLFRFEIPADNTIIGLYAEFTGSYDGVGNNDLNLTVTEVGYTAKTVNLEVQPIDVLGTIEHYITIHGIMA